MDLRSLFDDNEFKAILDDTGRAILQIGEACEARTKAPPPAIGVAIACTFAHAAVAMCMAAGMSRPEAIRFLTVSLGAGAN